MEFYTRTWHIILYFILYSEYTIRVLTLAQLTLKLEFLRELYCDVKSSRLGYDLPMSLNDRVISPLREGFIFICEVSRK